MLQIQQTLSIPESEFELTYVRSSGPGGQNVNKVSSKCQLRWNVLRSPSIPSHLRERMIAKLASRLTTEGELLISCDSHRDQGRNREECLVRLKMLLVEALHVPKKRKATRATKSSQRKRVESKRKRSEIKGMRGRVR
jgi:ribosome-associated protein